MITSNCVKLLEVKNTILPLLTNVQTTYIDSFPETERRDFDLFCKLLTNEERFRLYVILYNEEYAGFITLWQFEGFYYVEHFAIDSAFRSGGIGSVAMTKVKDMLDTNIILEVEDPIDDLTKRRVRFYEALGFCIVDANYKQPPYREGDSWYDMKLMSFGELEMKKEYERVRDCIYEYVYNIKKA